MEGILGYSWDAIEMLGCCFLCESRKACFVTGFS
jgi:hypothetical protein